MTVGQAFLILETDQTRDLSKIKHAYALKSRTCHPEEDPGGWIKLNEAYQVAQEFAKGMRSSSFDNDLLKRKTKIDISSLKKNADKETDFWGNKEKGDEKQADENQMFEKISNADAGFEGIVSGLERYNAKLIEVMGTLQADGRAFANKEKELLAEFEKVVLQLESSEITWLSEDLVDRVVKGLNIPERWVPSRPYKQGMSKLILRIISLLDERVWYQQNERLRGLLGKYDGRIKIPKGLLYVAIAAACWISFVYYEVTFHYEVKYDVEDHVVHYVDYENDLPENSLVKLELKSASKKNSGVHTEFESIRVGNHTENITHTTHCTFVEGITKDDIKVTILFKQLSTNSMYDSVNSRKAKEFVDNINNPDINDVVYGKIGKGDYGVLAKDIMDNMLNREPGESAMDIQEMLKDDNGEFNNKYPSEGLYVYILDNPQKEGTVVYRTETKEVFDATYLSGFIISVLIVAGLIMIRFGVFKEVVTVR